MEVLSFNLLEKGVEGFLVWEKKIGMSECFGFGIGLNILVDVVLSVSVIVEEIIMKMEFGKRCIF